jgi:hypothetical protein
MPPAPPMLARPVVPLLMVLPAWPALAAPPSPELLLRPELLHASTSKPAGKRDTTPVDMLHVGTNMGHSRWGLR